MKKVLLVMLLSVAAVAQVAHTATVSWGLPIDATSTGTITVYRGVGDCSTNPLMSEVGTPVDVNLLKYVDPITPGIYCYYVIHTENKMDSVPSTTAVAVLRPNAASGITIVVK